MKLDLNDLKEVTCVVCNEVMPFEESEYIICQNKEEHIQAIPILFLCEPCINKLQEKDKEIMEIITKLLEGFKGNIEKAQKDARNN